jgi:hypothetical protein
VQPLINRHVEEVSVTAEVELVAFVDADSSFEEEVDQCPVDDGGSDLAFDVVACDGEFLFFELLGPVVV